MAHCVGCGHEWMAVAPCEKKFFGCPACHAEKGYRKVHVRPKEAKVFACGCCEGFLWVPYQHETDGTPCLMCAECGHVVNALDIFP
jgi:hypothetical protein